MFKNEVSLLARPRFWPSFMWGTKDKFLGKKWVFPCESRAVSEGWKTSRLSSLVAGGLWGTDYWGNALSEDKLNLHYLELVHSPCRSLSFISSTRNYLVSWWTNVCPEELVFRKDNTKFGDSLSQVSLFSAAFWFLRLKKGACSDKNWG